MRPAATTTIPTIHLGGGDDDEEQAKTVQKLRECCLEHDGVFYLNGHGMEELFPKILAQSKKLFALSLDEKKRLNDPKTSRGYRCMMENEIMDRPNNRVVGDTKQGFYIGHHYPPEHPWYNPNKLRGPNVWPTKENSSMQGCDDFQRIVEEYHEKVSSVAQQLVQLLLLAVGLEDKHALDSVFSEHFGLLKLLHYAAVKSEPENGIFGCHEHSDYGMLTLLLADENSQGLQIQKQKTGEWVDVPPQKGSLIVFVGDMLEQWTNGIFCATVHRVLTNGDKERYSVPFFYDPDFDCVAECFPTTALSCRSSPDRTKSDGQYLKYVQDNCNQDTKPNKSEPTLIPSYFLKIEKGV